MKQRYDRPQDVPLNRIVRLHLVGEGETLARVTNVEEEAGRLDIEVLSDSESVTSTDSIAFADFSHAEPAEA